MSKISVLLSITLILSIPLFAQKNKGNQDTFLEAEYFYMSGAYSDAVNLYTQLYEKMPENSNLAYCLGLCYLNLSGKKDLAISYFESAVKNMSDKRKEGTVKQVTAPYNALYNLGKAYRINYKFDKAKEAFLRYEKTLKPDDTENIAFVKHEIQVCETAGNFIAKPIAYSEENIGDLFNDEKANFDPLISADGRSFAFKVSLKFYDAIMYSRIIEGKWSPPVNISPDLQADGDLFISCLTFDGRQLLLSKDDNFNSDIFASIYDGTKWSKIFTLNNNINTKYWESHGFISENGNQLIFASDRPGGFGGLDLYISQKADGEWGPAVNLGPEINTQFNEDRPFLINNGKTLFFSSQGHQNIGGYDLFRSDLVTGSNWSKPTNLGYPLNTPDDNIFFMPNGDGKSGYYSVYKSTGGFGREDIYKIIFK